MGNVGFYFLEIFRGQVVGDDALLAKDLRHG